MMGMAAERLGGGDPASYRRPMAVTEVMIYWNGAGYYICPRCRITLEREFMAYCDRCGQCLDWRQYRKVKRIYAPRK